MLSTVVDGGVLRTASNSSECVGDGSIMGARLAGASRIIVVDTDLKKLERAKEFGATHTVDALEVDTVCGIKSLTGKTAQTS